MRERIIGLSLTFIYLKLATIIWFQYLLVKKDRLSSSVLETFLLLGWGVEDFSLEYLVTVSYNSCFTLLTCVCTQQNPRTCTRNSSYYYLHHDLDYHPLVVLNYSCMLIDRVDQSPSEAPWRFRFTMIVPTILWKLHSRVSSCPTECSENWGSEVDPYCFEVVCSYSWS